ncbi:hypothetical protein AWENTII_005288 [Aspergillus wentii]
MFGGRSKELESTVSEIQGMRDSLMRIEGIAFREVALSVLKGLQQDATVVHELYNTIEETVVPTVQRIETNQNTIIDDHARDKIQALFKAQREWLSTGTTAGLDVHATQYSANLNERYPNTCQWIYNPDEAREFDHWRNKPEPSLLWLRGDGGFGKSILISSIIKYVENDILQSDQPALLVYFFCKAGDEATSRGSKIMLHLLRQLFCTVESQIQKAGTVEKQEKMIKIVQDARKRLPESAKTNASLAPLSTVLRPMLKDLAKVLDSRIYVVVDAIDECSDWKQTGFLDALKDLPQSGSNIKVLISSRPEPDLHESLYYVPKIAIDESRTEADIRSYVSGSLKGYLRSWKRKEKDEASAAIAKSSEGIFRYAKVVVTSLKAKGPPFKKLMGELPRGMNHLYRQSIEHLDADSREKLLVVLRWLTCGVGQMGLSPIFDELENVYDEDEQSDAEDVSVDDMEDRKDRESEAINDLIKIGRDFLKVGEGTVELQHNSIRGFIAEDEVHLDKQDLRCPDCADRFVKNSTVQAAPKYGHLLMAEMLLRHLNCPRFQKKFLCDNEVQDQPIEGRDTEDEYKDVRYEILHWAYHVRSAELVWPEEARDEDIVDRFDAIYDSVERFMQPDSQVYQNWLKKAHPWRKFEQPDQPLHIAARYGVVGLLKRYLSQEVDVNMANEGNNTPLHFCCTGDGDYQGMELLIEAGANPNLQGPVVADSPLITLVNSPYPTPAMVEYLLSKGANPDLRDSSGRTCLHYAVDRGSLGMCQALLKHGANANVRDESGQTPIHGVFRLANHLAVAQLLLDHQADVNVQNNKGWTPLHCANIADNVEGARLLLSRGADINQVETPFGITALHLAVFKGNLGMVQLLVNRGADVNMRDESQQNPVFTAVSKDQAEILSYLLSVYKAKGLNLDCLYTKNTSGNTPLHLAAMSSSPIAARLLIDAGDAPRMCRQRSQDDSTPLHCAAFHGCVETVKLLLLHDPDPTARIHEYKTPVHLALRAWKRADETGKPRFVETLKVFNETVPDLTRQPEILDLAVTVGCKAMCSELASLVNGVDCHAWTPLALAIQEGNDDIISLLSKNDSRNVLATSQSGQFLLGHPPSCWSAADKHEQLTISENGVQLSDFNPGEPISESPTEPMVARADHSVPAGSKGYYYEVTILESNVPNPAVAIGYCDKYAQLDKMPGWNNAEAPTWGYHGDDGRAYHYLHDCGEGQDYAESYGPGDTIGCGVDFVTGIIFYTRNGIRLGNAFEEVKGRLFPALGLHDGSTTVWGNFGQEPFKYKEWEADCIV